MAEIYYRLGEFRKVREALADQVSLILRNSTAVSLSAQDTSFNLRKAIAAHLNDSRSNQLSGDLQIFEDLASYFDALSTGVQNNLTKKDLEERVKKLEALVLELTAGNKLDKPLSVRKVFVESFVKTCGSTAAVALISGGTLLLGRYAPSAMETLTDMIFGR